MLTWGRTAPIAEVTYEPVVKHSRVNDAKRIPMNHITRCVVLIPPSRPPSPCRVLSTVVLSASTALATTMPHGWTRVGWKGFFPL